MPIYRVSSDYYDKMWYVKAKTSERALELVTKLTEVLGWHLDYLDEKRDWNCERVFEKEDEIIEDRDL